MLSKKIILTDEQLERMAVIYRQTLNVRQTAKIINLGINRTRRELKKMGVLLSLSDYAKKRVGEKNHFFGKTHSEKVRKRNSEVMKSRTGDRNPNYKNGKYLRRPRDFKISEFGPIRKFVFNRDNYTCQISGIKGGHLHAHHLIPYWVCPDAFFDPENLITVSTESHFLVCHKGDWAKFDTTLISDELLKKYSISRERLNELATFNNKRRCDSPT